MYNRLQIYKKWYLPVIRKRQVKHYLKQVSTKEKPLFIHINRTGGTSIASALGITAIHHTLEEYEALYSKQFGTAMPRDTPILVSIRNPFDKVASQYFYRCQTDQNRLRSQPIDFTEWVKKAYREKNSYYRDREIMFQSQGEWIQGHERYSLTIIRFENIAEEYDILATQFGGEALPWLKKSRNRDYQKLYSQEARAIVQEVFSNDLQRFNYSF